ncbi:hypothetical protein Y032_0379g319 [Ancylostoma ceylanicum]|uniref:Uncharacterized protein n=1 Tax=Ancylostoma ceylanicum TaxID=53326 RepID=A0A016RTF9_9BILA|nr:hypothetical protein Y032_0379g319 [Ancylostoma ceylanicum]
MQPRKRVQSAEKQVRLIIEDPFISSNLLSVFKQCGIELRDPETSVNIVRVDVLTGSRGLLEKTRHDIRRWKDWRLITETIEGSIRNRTLPGHMGLFPFGCQMPGEDTNGTHGGFNLKYCEEWWLNLQTWEKIVSAAMVVAALAEAFALVWNCFTWCACCCKQFLIHPLTLASLLATIALGTAVAFYGINNQSAFESLPILIDYGRLLSNTIKGNRSTISGISGLNSTISTAAKIQKSRTWDLLEDKVNVSEGVNNWNDIKDKFETEVRKELFEREECIVAKKGEITQT